MQLISLAKIVKFYTKYACLLILISIIIIFGQLESLISTTKLLCFAEMSNSTKIIIIILSYMEKFTNSTVFGVYNRLKCPINDR